MPSDTQNLLVSILLWIVLALIVTVLALIWFGTEWTSGRRWAATTVVMIFVAGASFILFQLVFGIR